MTGPFLFARCLSGRAVRTRPGALPGRFGPSTEPSRRLWTAPCLGGCLVSRSQSATLTVPITPNTPATPDAAPLHDAFLSILPRIELHGHVSFRSLKCQHLKEEFLRPLELRAKSVELPWFPPGRLVPGVTFSWALRRRRRPCRSAARVGCRPDGPGIAGRRQRAPPPARAVNSCRTPESAKRSNPGHSSTTFLVRQAESEPQCRSPSGQPGVSGAPLSPD
jgi:hypothetical protein